MKIVINLSIRQPTIKETKILQLMSGGKSTREIADKLCLSYFIIDAHRLKNFKEIKFKRKLFAVAFCNAV